MPTFFAPLIVAVVLFLTPAKPSHAITDKPTPAASTVALLD